MHPSTLAQYLENQTTIRHYSDRDIDSPEYEHADCHFCCGTRKIEATRKEVREYLDEVDFAGEAPCFRLRTWRSWEDDHKVPCVCDR